MNRRKLKDCIEFKSKVSTGHGVALDYLVLLIKEIIYLERPYELEARELASV